MCPFWKTWNRSQDARAMESPYILHLQASSQHDDKRDKNGVYLRRGKQRFSGRPLKPVLNDVEERKSEADKNDRRGYSS